MSRQGRTVPPDYPIQQTLAEATRSRFKGVTRARGRWQAQITVNGGTVYLGKFDSEEAAAEACALAREHGVLAQPSRDHGLSDADLAKLDRSGPTPVHAPELGPCWVWTGYVAADGYGRHSTVQGGRRAPRLVHRLAYEKARGPIPPDLEIDHLCRNRACAKVRPHRPDGTADPTDHLDAVTKAENIRRGAAGEHHRSKTHCPQGHPYDAINTYRWRGTRRCRACLSAQARNPGLAMHCTEVPTPEEEDVYAAIGWPYTPPEARR